MAAKKKKAAKKRASTSGRRPPPNKCTQANICRYLAEWDRWFRNEFYPDYLKLQRAVCHLERVVLDARLPNNALRRCGGAGGGVEPPDPPPPPSW